MCLLDEFQNVSQAMLIWLVDRWAMLGLIIISIGIMSVLYRRRRGSEDASVTTGQKSNENSPVISNQAQITRLLMEHGGQIRQQQIVTETGWSKAKVSTLLSRMEADDHLTKVRLGRENLIMLSGHEPQILTSALNIDEDQD
jgi:uncharacterized membrane protein